MTSVRIVVFGQGFARSVVLPCLRHVPGAQVVGMASPSLARLRETAAAFGVAAVSDDHREILDRTRPDLAIIATPPHRHAEQAIDALRAGCHVLCEKPMALDSAEAGRMVEAAAARPDRLALIDHELRLLPARVRLAQLVADGELGRLQRLEYFMHSSFRRRPEQPWSWWSDAGCGGGMLGALGSHAVDALRRLGGEIVEVRGRLETGAPARPDPATGVPRPITADDVAEAWLRFASGAQGTFLLSALEAERIHRLTLSGTEGWAQLEEQRPLRVARRDMEPQPVEIPEELPSSSELGIPDTDWARAFLRLARALVSAIAEGGDLPAAASFADGLAVQRVLDAVRISAAREAWEPVVSR